MKIEKGKNVRLAYQLLDPNGEVLDEGTEEGEGENEPIEYMHGSEELLPVLQASLEGAKVGDELEVEVAPEDSFGPHDPEALISVPRDEFPEDTPLEKGEMIEISIVPEDGDDAEEESLEMRVIDFNDEAVFLDGNHPFAGMKTVFKLRVLSIT